VQACTHACMHALRFHLKNSVVNLQPSKKSTSTNLYSCYDSVIPRCLINLQRSQKCNSIYMVVNVSKKEYIIFVNCHVVALILPLNCTVTVCCCCDTEFKKEKR
jgi:hypothetical protein